MQAGDAGQDAHMPVLVSVQGVRGENIFKNSENMKQKILGENEEKRTSRGVHAGSGAGDAEGAGGAGA